MLARPWNGTAARTARGHSSWVIARLVIRNTRRSVRRQAGARRTPRYRPENASTVPKIALAASRIRRTGRRSRSPPTRARPKPPLRPAKHASLLGATRLRSEKHAANINKRGQVVDKSAEKKKGKAPIGPLMIGFFLFVVVGSGLLQVIQTASFGAKIAEREKMPQQARSEKPPPKRKPKKPKAEV